MKAVLTLAVSMMAVGTVKAAEAVDLQQYSGVWYEIARTPESFDSDCVSDVKAEYTVLSEGVVKVVNTCMTATGEVKTVNGLAQDVGNNTLLISFEPLESSDDPLDAWDFTDAGEYRILEVGPGYSYAVVGHPGGTSAWILSRTPDMSPGDLAEAEDVLVAQGYDTCLLMTTVQNGGLTKSSQLCKANDETGAADEGTTPPDETMPPEDDTNAPEDGTVPGDQVEEPVLEVLQADGRFSEFLSAVEIAGLTEVLQGEGPFTLFVPTDEAFDKLSAEQKAELMENPEALSKLLMGHVMRGDYKAADLEGLNAPKNAAAGEMAFSTVDGAHRVNGVKIISADMHASNGTIHVIDAVLMK